jgi:uncharacterized protein (UPF0335 family)
MSKSNSGPIFSADRLRSFVERIERLEEERKAISGDIRDVYAEAKGVGYDVKIMRKVVQLRKMDAAERDEQEALLDTYWHALSTVDRIEARAAAGESARQIATAENVSKSTAHRVSQKARSKTDGEELGRTETAPDVPGEGAVIGPEIGSGSLATTNGQEAGDALEESDEHEGLEPSGEDRRSHRRVPAGPDPTEREVLSGRPSGADEGGTRSTEAPSCDASLRRIRDGLREFVAVGEEIPAKLEIGAVAEPSAAQRVARPEQDQAVDLSNSNPIPSFLRRQAST